MSATPPAPDACGCGHDHDHGHHHEHAPGGGEYRDPLACPCGCGKNKGGGGWLMLAGIVAVVAVTIWLATRTKSMDPASYTGRSAGGFTSVELARGERVTVAAAAARDVTEPFALRDDLPGGAAGPALYVGPEKWNDTWKEKAETGQVKVEDFKKGHPEAQYPGFARLDFTVPKTARYELWLRAYWVDQCGDSMGLVIDDRPPVTAIDSNHGRWVWTPIRSGEGRPVAFALDEGRHTLTLFNREDDCYVAKILLRELTGASEPPPGELD